MSDWTDTCPADDELTAFLEEALPPERQVRIADHLDGCSNCQLHLDALTVNSDEIGQYQDLTKNARDSLPLPSFRITPDDRHKTIPLNNRPAMPTSDQFLDLLPFVPGFEILSEIGRGGMGVVYKARHKQLNRLCALKVVIAGGTADARTIQRFLFEAEVLARIEHPQVVKVYDVGTYRGPAGIPIPYLAMEYLDGGTLAELAAREPQPPRQAAAIIEGLANAVHAVHMQGVVHRDLKPGNILFSRPKAFGNDWQLRDRSGNPVSNLPQNFPSLPRVSDFGLAKFTEGAAELTASGVIIGTPGYMAPEQAQGSKQIGPACDIYALGAILFELLTGRPPYDGKEPMNILVQVMSGRAPNVRSVRPDCPTVLASIVAKCLSKETEQRYPTAAALAQDLNNYLNNRPTIARPLHPIRQLTMAMQRHLTVSLLVFALLLVLGVGLGIGYTQWREAQIKAAIATEAQQIEAEERQRAEQALQTAGRERARARRRELTLKVERSLRACDDRQTAIGLPGLLNCVEIADQIGDNDLVAALRRNLATWPQGLPQYLAEYPQANHAAVQAIAISEDGQFLVTAGKFATVNVWDLKQHKLVQRLITNPLHLKAKSPIPTFWSVAINPSGDRVAAAGSDGQAWIWDRSKEWSLRSIKLVDTDVWSVTFNSAGQLWTGDTEGRLRLWNPETGKRIKELKAEKPSCIMILKLIDDEHILVGNRAGIMTEWHVPTGKPLQEYQHQGWVTRIAVAPDQRYLAATGPSGSVDLWKRGTPERVFHSDLGGAHGFGLAFDSAGQILLSSDNEGNIRCHNIRRGGSSDLILRVPFGTQYLAMRPGTEEFLVASGNTVTRWQSPGLRCLPLGSSPRWIDQTEMVRSIDFHPHSQEVLVTRRHLEIFDPTDGKLLHTIRTQTPSLQARFHPEGNNVVRTDRSGWWKVDLFGRESRVSANRDAYMIAMAFSARGDALLTSDGNSLYLTDSHTGKPRRQMYLNNRLATDEIRVVASSNHRSEWMISLGSRLCFLDSNAEFLKENSIQTSDEILTAHYSPDSNLIFAGLRNGTVEVWDANTHDQLPLHIGHHLAVTSLAVTPDGETLLTGSRDGTARFWDTRTGLPIGPPLVHSHAVVAVAISPDGKSAATGTTSGEALMWKVPGPPSTRSLDEMRSDFTRFAVTPPPAQLLDISLRP